MAPISGPLTRLPQNSILKFALDRSSARLRPPIRPAHADKSLFGVHMDRETSTSEQLLSVCAGRTGGRKATCRHARVEMGVIFSHLSCFGASRPVVASRRGYALTHSGSPLERYLYPKVLHMESHKVVSLGQLWRASRPVPLS